MVQSLRLIFNACIAQLFSIEMDDNVCIHFYFFSTKNSFTNWCMYEEREGEKRETKRMKESKQEKWNANIENNCMTLDWAY